MAKTRVQVSEGERGMLEGENGVQLAQDLRSERKSEFLRGMIVDWAY